MRRGFLTPAFWTALTLAVGLLAWLPAPAQAVLIACDEAALRTAINDAGTGDTITIPDLCTITLSGAADDDNNLNGDLDIAGNTGAATLTIQGAGPGRTIIDGGGHDRVFDIGAGKTVTLTGLTIRNGDATQNAGEKKGGGIFNDGSTLTVTNAEIINNKGTLGGGIYDNAGGVTLTDVTVSGNTATAAEGGGLSFDLTQDTLTNVTISGNSANTSGGGIFHLAGPLTLTNVTIAENTAVLQAGGFSGGGAGNFVTNTLMAGNTAPTKPDCSGTLSTSSHNLIQSNTGGCTGTTGTDLVNVDPKIAPLANNGGFTLTHALLPGSPAINAGDAAACTGPATTDQRGTARSGTCDIGAFELAPSILAISLNDISYDAGDTLTVDAVLFNSGAAVTVDAYLGFFLPDGILPGCPAVPLVFVNSSSGLVFLCGATTPASDFPKFVAGLTIQTATSPSVFTGVFSATIPVAPLGVIEAFAALTVAGSLDDDAIGPADVLAFPSVEFAVPAP